MIKRLLFLLVTLSLVISLIACDEMDASSNDNPDAEEIDKEKEKEEKKLAKEKEKEIAKQEKEAKKEQKKKEKEEKKIAKEKEKDAKKLAKEKEKKEKEAAKEKKKQEKLDKEKTEEEAEKKEKEKKKTIEEVVLDEHSSIEKATLEDGYLKIELDADGSFSVNTMFSHPANDALEAMNTAFKDDKVDTVGAIVKGTLIDDKGNESKEDVISIYFDRDNFEEFDFENFKKMSLAEPWRIYNESDSYYIHPAIYKDIKEKNTSNLVNGSSKVE